MINFGSVNVAFKFLRESSTSFAFYGNLTFKSLHLTIVAFHADDLNKMAQHAVLSTVVLHGVKVDLVYI